MPPTAKQPKATVVIVDVRTPAEFAISRIEGVWLASSSLLILKALHFWVGGCAIRPFALGFCGFNYHYLSLSLSLRAFAGSTNIPIGTLVQGGDVTADGALALRQLLLHTLSEDVQAVDVCLICRTGARSSVACAALSQRLSEGPALDVGVGGDRHLRVLNVVGGLRAWSEKVDPRIHV